MSAQLDALAARIATLEAGHRRFEVFVQARGARDQADTDLVLAVVTATEGLPFTAKALWVLRQRDTALAAALRDADLTSPREIGAWLRRMDGVPTNIDWCVSRGRKRRDGCLWRLVRLSPSPMPSAPDCRT
ncbi:MAG: hypothetical protein M3545_06385 [Acidobacteriota bacterium]|nr:hypothetical protein [Acidobacteriota bacterium]